MQRQGQLILLNRIAKRALKKSKIKKINSTQWQIAKGGSEMAVEKEKGTEKKLWKLDGKLMRKKPKAQI